MRQQDDQSSNDAALEELLTLIEDYHDYNPGNVMYCPHLPSAIQFSKQVSRGSPCVYPAKQALAGYAAGRWNEKYLTESVDGEVEVAVTPDGRADSICNLNGPKSDEQVFLQPATVNMSMKSLLDHLNTEASAPVYYLQSQNSNLTTTNLEVLLKDLPPNFAFAEELLGPPEAINIWIGDQRSVTSAHRDPYENIYIVLRGSKTFTLWPPVDEVCMDARMVRTGQYVYDQESSAFRICMDTNECSLDEVPQIPWISVDPQLSREELNSKHALYQYAKPRTVVVEQGQMLYLPSGWYHHVAQTCGKWDDGSPAPCIAINYWYDMDYEGEKYVTRQLIGRLTQRVQQRMSAPK